MWHYVVIHPTLIVAVDVHLAIYYVDIMVPVVQYSVSRYKIMDLSVADRVMVFNLYLYFIIDTQNTPYLTVSWWTSYPTTIRRSRLLIIRTRLMWSVFKLQLTYRYPHNYCPLFLCCNLHVSSKWYQLLSLFCSFETFISLLDLLFEFLLWAITLFDQFNVPILHIQQT